MTRIKETRASKRRTMSRFPETTAQHTGNRGSVKMIKCRFVRVRPRVPIEIKTWEASGDGTVPDRPHPIIRQSCPPEDGKEIKTKKRAVCNREVWEWRGSWK